MVGEYAGELGCFCYDNDLPLLNSLIVKAGEPKPSHGYPEWMKAQELEVDWSEEVFNCFKRFHVTSNRERQSRHFSGLNPIVRNWFE
jgi:hypothetical protein